MMKTLFTGLIVGGLAQLAGIYAYAYYTGQEINWRSPQVTAMAVGVTMGAGGASLSSNRLF